MGNVQSSTISQAITLLNQSITNVIQTNTTNTSSFNNTRTTLTVILNGVKNCDFVANQSTKSSTTLNSLAQYQSLDSVKTLMKASLDQTVEALQKSQNEFLSTTFSKQKADIDIKDQLSNIIDNNVTNSNIVNIVSSASSIADGKYEIYNYDCSEKGSINLSQEAILNSFVSTVSDSIQKALMDNDQISNAVTKIQQQQEAENKGIGDAIMKALSGLGFAFAGVFLLVIAVVIVFKMTGSGGSKKSHGFSIRF